MLRSNEQRKHELESLYCDFPGCNLAGKRFCDKSSRNRHMDEKHLKLNRYACTFCGREYKRLSNSGRHLKSCKPYKALIKSREEQIAGGMETGMRIWRLSSPRRIAL